MIEYRIYKNLYDEIVKGKKNTELRLLNDKSVCIKVGDKIRFKVLDEEKYIIVKVINLKIFENIDELWNNKSITKLIMQLSFDDLGKKCISDREIENYTVILSNRVKDIRKKVLIKLHNNPVINKYYYS